MTANNPGKPQQNNEKVEATLIGLDNWTACGEGNKAERHKVDTRISHADKAATGVLWMF